MKTLKELFYELVSEGFGSNPVLIERGDYQGEKAALQEFEVHRTLISAISSYGKYSDKYKVDRYYKCCIEINGKYTDKVGIKIKIISQFDKIKIQ